jgi:hypothetical protein
MSDFKTIKDFTKGKNASLPYQDPTYLSFVLLFDFSDDQNSPLLAQNGALKYYDRLIKDAGDNKSFFEERKEDLENFIMALRKINNEMPWYWQSLAGLDNILKYDTEKNYKGGAESLLTITTLESINLAVTGLMHLYRKAVFDEYKWGWILPANLRKFRMYVYVTEIRSIRNFDEAGLNPFKKKVTPITGQDARPYFMFSLNFCEFDIKSGTTAFADLSKNPENAASSDIVIMYERLNQIQSRVLNGIVETKYNDDKISPAPDFEKQNRSLSARLIQKGEDFSEQLVDDLKRLSRDKQLEIEQFIRNNTTNKFQDPGNIFKNFVRRVDEATDINKQTRDIGAAVQQNVFGTKSGDNIGSTLDRAAGESLGNIYGG